eukprot:g7397.t1
MVGGGTEGDVDEHLHDHVGVEVDREDRDLLARHVALGSLLEERGLRTGVELGVQRGIFSVELLQRWRSFEDYVLVDLWSEAKLSEFVYKDASGRKSEESQNAYLQETVDTLEKQILAYHNVVDEEVPWHEEEEDVVGDLHDGVVNRTKVGGSSAGTTGQGGEGRNKGKGRVVVQFVGLNSQAAPTERKMVTPAGEKNIFTPRIRACRDLTSACVAHFPDGYFDFIYVDARHDYKGVFEDLELWWPKLKVKRPSVIAGHDFLSAYEHRLHTGHSQDFYEVNFDGSYDVTARAVKGAVMDFFGTLLGSSSGVLQLESIDVHTEHRSWMVDIGKMMSEQGPSEGNGNLRSSGVMSSRSTRTPSSTFQGWSESVRMPRTMHVFFVGLLGEGFCAGSEEKPGNHVRTNGEVRRAHRNLERLELLHPGWAIVLWTPDLLLKKWEELFPPDLVARTSSSLALEHQLQELRANLQKAGEAMQQKAKQVCEAFARENEEIVTSKISGELEEEPTPNSAHDGAATSSEEAGDHEISSAENKAPEGSDHVGSTSRVEKDTSAAARERDGSTPEEQIMGQWRKFLFKYAWTLKRAVQQLVRNGKKKGASDGVRAGAGEALLKRLRLATGARTTGMTMSAAAVAEDKQGQGQEVVDPPPADEGPRPDYEDYKVGDIVALVSNFGGCSSGRLLRIEGIEEATDKSKGVVLLKSVMVGGPDDEDGINGRGERDHTATSAVLMRVPKSATQGDARVLSVPLFSGAADEDTAIRVSLVADDGPPAGGKGSNDILQETFLFDPERNLLRPDDTYAAQRGHLRATLVNKMRQVAGLAREDVAHFVDHVKPASASAINSTLVQELPRSFGLAAVPVQPDGSIVALRGPGGRAVRVTDLLEQVVGPLNDAIVQIGNGKRRGRGAGKGASTTTTTLYSMYLELPERLPNPKRLQEQEEQSKKNGSGGSRSGRESSSWTKTQLVRFRRLFSSGPSKKSPDPVARGEETGTPSSFIALRGGDGKRTSFARSKMNTTTEAGVAEDAFFDRAVGEARGDDIQTASELVDALRFHGKCAAPGDEAQWSEESEGMKNLKYAAQKLQEWGSDIAWNAGETAAGLAHDVVTERDGRGRK